MKGPSRTHIKKDMKQEREIMEDSKEIGKAAKEMNKDDKKLLRKKEHRMKK